MIWRSEECGRLLKRRHRPVEVSTLFEGGVGGSGKKYEVTSTKERASSALQLQSPPSVTSTLAISSRLIDF